jgi:hypothetical protein
VSELTLKDSRGATLFFIGSIGYVVGFLAWLFWLLLIVSTLFIDWHGHPSIMSGIFFQSGFYFMIDYLLFSISFALGSFGCFGLKKKYDSDLALICGIIYVITAANFFVYLLPKFGPWVGYGLVYLYLPAALFIGMLMWGTTLFVVRKPSQSTPGLYSRLNNARLAGTLFLVAGFIGVFFYPVILYWGIEWWFLLAGWLYTAGALVTARLLFQMSEA